MSKIYAVEYCTGLDYEGNRMSVLAHYIRREDAEAHLKWIEARLHDFILDNGYGKILEFVPGQYICREGFNGDYDRWEIVEYELQDSFNEKTTDVM